MTLGTTSSIDLDQIVIDGKRGLHALGNCRNNELNALGAVLRQTKNQLSWEKYLAVYLGGLASGALLIVCALVR